MCARFSPDGSAIAVGLLDGSIRIYESETGKLLHVLSDEDTRKARLPASAIRFLPVSLADPLSQRHLLIASYVSGHVKFWHYTSGNAVATLTEGRQLLCMALNAEGTRLLTSGSTAQISIYDLPTRRKMATCEPSESRELMNGHRSRVFSAAYHPTAALASQFVSGGWDNTMHFWDDRVRHSTRRVYGPHLCGSDAIDIDASNAPGSALGHIVTASWRNADSLQVWDYATGEKYKDVPQDNYSKSLLYCGQYVSKDFILSGGSDHNMARLIDRTTYGTSGAVLDLPASVYALDSTRPSSGNPKLAICSANLVLLLTPSRRTFGDQRPPGTDRPV